MLALYRFASRWPLWLLHALGAALGWLTWAASPTYRRRIAENAGRAGYRFAELRACVAQAGRMVAETPRLWFGAPVAVQWQGREHLEAAYAARRGIVFMTPHMGCFEITAQAVGTQYHLQHGPITVLYRPSRQAALAQVVETARRREKQIAYNLEHGITPATIRKKVNDVMEGAHVAIKAKKAHKDKQGGANAMLTPAEADKRIRQLEKDMLEHAQNLEFEQAAALRDEIRQLQEMAFIQ